MSGNKNFGITQAEYEAAIVYANYFDNWVRAVCSEIAYGRNQPGSTVNVPEDTPTHDERVLEYLNGVDKRDTFDRQYADQLIELATELGLTARGTSGYTPFTLYIEDREDKNQFNTRIVVWFWPNGEFYAAHGRYGDFDAINELPYNARQIFRHMTTKIIMARGVELAKRESVTK